MKYVVSAFVEACLQLKNSPRIILVYFVLGLLPWLVSLNRTPPILDLLFLIISLGWFAARFELLQVIRKDKSFQLQTTFSHIWKYAMAMLPRLIGFVLLSLVPFFLVSIWYGRWFSMQYLDQGLGYTSQEVFYNFLSALFNLSLWAEFWSQNLFTRLMQQFFALMVIIGFLIAKLTMVLWVVEKFNFNEALVRAFFYLNDQLPLLSAFLVLRVSANILYRGFEKLFIWLDVAFLTVIVLTAIVAFTASLIDFFILEYYVKADKKSFVKRNLMRWWRTLGQSSQ